LANGITKTIRSMRPFDLVLVPFPFTDLSTTKQRPCLILSSFQPKGLPEHYVVAMVTSHLNGLAFPGDTRLGKWNEAGLPKPSLVRLSKVVTLERQLIRKRLGSIQGPDRQAIRRQFRQVFAELL
jgi:mRNA interferase MazF